MTNRKLALLLVTVSLSQLAAQTPVPFASGLLNPSRAIVIPGGSILVTEAGTDNNSGRISLIDRAANRRTLIDGLPSGMAAPDFSIDGPNGLVLSGRTLYIAIGEGDSHRNGTVANTIIPNPAGPSSPMYATVLKITFNKDITSLNAGFSLKLADHSTLMDGADVALTNTSGETATASLIAAFRVDRPDPNSIYRNTHLYGMTVLESQPNKLYVVDAGNNALWQVDATSGKQQVLVRFPSTPNPISPVGPPFSEAVPTSVRPYGAHLLVTLLSGAPFVSGTSRVVEVDPATGAMTPFITLLSSTIDLIYRTKASGALQWFVLEYSLGSLSVSPTAPGQLLVYSTTAAQVLAGNLATPTGLALDETTGDLYIINRQGGSISRINVGL